MSEQRKLVNRKRFGATLDNNIYDRLKAYSDKTSIPITKILDKSVDEWLKKNDK